MRSQIGIDMSAPPQRIFDLARDISRWPALLPHYRKVTIESRNGERTTARMAAVRRVGPLGVPVSWRAEQWADPAEAADLKLHFQHVSGATKGMDVTWHIRDTSAGGRAQSRVTIEHVFSRPLPLIGSEALPGIVDRLFVRPIASQTLATFKRLAESAG
jgi:ribosome-associated toxin RatA of RatAB toxin-antitoxin module